MKNININQSILFFSSFFHYIIILTIAMLCGKIVWWIINPIGYNLSQNAVTNIAKVETVAQGIINRAPFGIITAEKVVSAPIVDNIKVVGIYAAGPKNSVVFLQINDKNSIAMLGESIQDSQIKSITTNSVIITKNGKEQTLYLTTNSTNASNPNVPSYAKHDNTSTNQSLDDNDNHQNTAPNSAQDNQNNAKMPDKDEGIPDIDSIADKRRKMIEAFQKQNANSNDH